MTYAPIESRTLHNVVTLCLLIGVALSAARVQAQAQPQAQAQGDDAARAQAQTDEAARAASARALFEEGVALADQGHWQEAADRFRRALALRESAVIAYNLASALTESGQLVEASELLRHVRSDASADAELHKSASNALAEIEPRLGKLSVHVQGLQSGDRVRVDARELLAAELDMALPIDPGAHVVRVERGSAAVAVAEQSVTVAEGQAQELSVQVAAPVATPTEVAVAAVAPPDPNARSAPDREPPLTKRWWFWAGAGAVVVGIGVAVAVAAAGGGDSGTAKPVAGDFEPGVVGVEVGR